MTNRSREKALKFYMSEEEDEALRAVADEFFYGNKAAAIRALVQVCKEEKELYLVNRNTGKIKTISVKIKN